MRVVPLVLLAAISLDLADGDCAKGSWAGQARCAAGQAPAGGCVCCLVSEAAASAADVGVPNAVDPAAAPPTPRTREGVRPVPYRPPLSRS
jgi:hypothetical protein